MNLVWTPTAWEQYTSWQTEDRKMVKRINELINDNLIIYSCKGHYEE
jgi:toxin YoeB